MVFSNGTDLSERMRTASAGQRVTCAMLGGAIAGAVVSLVTLPSAAVLIGWDVAVVIYLVWVWIAVWRLDPGTTGRDRRCHCRGSRLAGHSAQRRGPDRVGRRRRDLPGLGLDRGVEAGPRYHRPRSAVPLPGQSSRWSLCPAPRS